MTDLDQIIPLEVYVEDHGMIMQRLMHNLHVLAGSNDGRGVANRLVDEISLHFAGTMMQ